MSLLKNVIRCMEKIAPLQLAENAWDNVGLLVEAPVPRTDASRVFLCIDFNQKPVLDEALRDPKIGVIVAYHPPLFRAIKRLNMSDDKQRIALRCVAAGVSVFSPHTALDNCVGGINDWLASGLGKGETSTINAISNPPDGQSGSGSGRMHHLTNPLPLAEIVSQIKAHLKLPYVRLAEATDNRSQAVSSIAICAGSGASILSGVKADLYLTGEMSHHEVLAAVANKTNVVLAEHSNTERGYLSEVLQPRLQSLLRESVNDIEVICSTVDRDPLRVV